MNSENKINALLIFEILGRPPEHIAEFLKDIIKKVGSEKGVSIKYEKIHDPKEIEEEKGFYTTFAEVELELEEIFNLIVIMFKYMPAHVEISSPEKLQISNNKLNEFFNELARRLHSYDEVARVLQTEKNILENKLKEILEKTPKES